MMQKRLLAAIAFSIALSSAGAQARDLLLAPGDRIRVDVFGRQDLSVEQDVQPSGVVRLPLIGEVAAEGLSLGAVEQSVANILASGIEANPSVSVTAIRWRTVYVMGDVRTPRAVDYTPDLTVMKAVALAGGLGLPGSDELTAVEAVRSRARLNTAYAKRDQLLIRKSRLLAERDSLNEVQFPAATGSRPKDMNEVTDSERRLFEARQKDLQARLVSLDRLASTYGDEITSLEKQRGALDEELKIVSADVEASEKLSAKGLELRSRNSLVQRSRLDVMSRLAENIGFVSRATANLQETEQKQTTVPIQQEQEVLKELTAVQDELIGVEEIIVAESRILGENRSLALGASGGEARWRQMNIEIVRGDRRMIATERTELDPGDVVEITNPVDQPATEMQHSQAEAEVKK
jgi:protein involved in polysaccharide export with SLBB domain